MELGKFEILEELGRGGFGIVYKAHDKTLNRLVAIKELYPELLTDPSFLSRFKQEAQIAANLDNPNVVPVYEFGESKGRYYIVMGYMPGGSLKDLIKKEGSLSKERALEILQQFGAGLTYIHKKGVIHRDLKPGNILFDDSGKARISDMGFAKLLRGNSGKSISGSGGLVGTPAYMAPEIWKEKPATAAVDIYSLACILVEMLIAEPLFQADSTPGVMLRHFEALKLPKNLPEEWKPAIKRALEKDPENRFGSVEEFLSALQTAEKKPVRLNAKTEEVKPEKVEPRKELTPRLKEGKSRESVASFQVRRGLHKNPLVAIYVGLGLVAALLAVFFLFRFFVFPPTPEPTVEPQTIQVQDTATIQPEPTAEPQPTLIINTPAARPNPTLTNPPPSTQSPTSMPSVNLEIPDYGYSYHWEYSYGNTYNMLFVGNNASYDWPRCSGSIDSVIVQSMTTGATFVEEFNSPVDFTQVGSTIYISNGKAVFDHLWMNGGPQFVYRSIPEISGPILITVIGQIDWWENNCVIWVGISDENIASPSQPTSAYPAVGYAWFGGGCSVQDPIIIPNGIPNAYPSNGCSFLRNAAPWVDAGVPVLTIYTVQ